MTTPKRHKKITGKIGTMLAVSGVAGLGVSIGAFVLSFDAIKAVAEAAHVSESISWLMPVSVDGAMTVATMAAMSLEVLGKKKLWYPGFVFVACLVISLLCNALHSAKSKTVGVGEAAKNVVELEPLYAALVSAIPAIALALTLHLLIMMIQAVGDYLSEGSEDLTGASPKVASEAPEGKISEPAEAAPVNLAATSLTASLATPPGAVSEPSLARSSEPSLAPSLARSSEPSEPLTGEPSEATPVRPPASSSEPPAKPVRKPSRPAAKPAKARQEAASGKIDITAMGDSDLLELLARDFAADELSANKIRLRYSIGTDKAKVIYDRWKTLTDITDEQLAAVGE
jgi:hypothetical protein